MALLSVPIFSSEQLARVVREALPTDADTGTKVLVGTVDQDGAQVVVAFKNIAAGDTRRPTWEVQAAARHTWAGDNQVGAKAIMQWK